MKLKILTAALAALLLLPLSTVTAYAGGGDSYDCAEPAVQAEATAPEPATEELPATEPEIEENPFTPSGTGTVVDNATDADGKEFFTITTPAENVFYLIIDRQRSTENVYFLNAVTEADLLALAEISETPVVTAPVEEAPATVEPEPEPEPEPQKSGGMGSILLVLLILLGGGGAGWYFKIYKPKQAQAEADDDEYAEDEAGLYDLDEADPYGDDLYGGDDQWLDEDSDPLDISPEDDPPWDEDGDSEAGEE